MKITIQNKSMESAPIVIDIPNKSEEGFGVSDGFSGVTCKTKDDLFNNSAFKYAVKNAKMWAERKGYEMATVEEVKSNKQTLFTQIFRRAGKVSATDPAYKAFTNMKLTSKDGATISIMEADYSMANAIADSLVVGLGSIMSFVRKLSGNGLLLTFIWFKRGDGKVFARGLVKAKWLKHDAQEEL